MLTFSNYDADATELLEFLRWKNLARQQEIHKATMMFRCLHGLAPEYLCSKFTWRDSAYDLRDDGTETKAEAQLSLIAGDPQLCVTFRGGRSVLAL